MTLDLRLLGIVCPRVGDLASLVADCRRAEAGGITALQLRWKDAGAGRLYGAAVALVDALTIPVFVNDRADVAQAAGAAGVHLGADDIPPMAVRPFTPGPFMIGASVGTRSEAAAIRDADVDYWSIGSIYDTGTKADAGTPIGLAGFQSLANLAPVGMPVLAIGGIRLADADDVLEAGAHGIAVSSAIFAVGDIEQSARALRAVVDRVLSR